MVWGYPIPAASRPAREIGWGWGSANLFASLVRALVQ